MSAQNPLPLWSERIYEASGVPAQGDDGLLVSLPVALPGRRFINQPTELSKADGMRCIPLLDHAGPEASTWAKDQSFSACGRKSFLTGRKSLVLPAEDWTYVLDDYERKAVDLKMHGVEMAVLGIDDDGLLATALAPHAPAYVEEKIRILLERLTGQLSSLGISLCVEDLAPGGQDAVQGIKNAQWLVNLGIDFIVASCGSWAFPPLKSRVPTKSKGENEMTENEAWMASPAWLLKKVDCPIYACGPVQNREKALVKAHRMGFAGLVAWAPNQDSVG